MKERTAGETSTTTRSIESPKSYGLHTIISEQPDVQGHSEVISAPPLQHERFSASVTFRIAAIKEPTNQ